MHRYLVTAIVAIALVTVGCGGAQVVTEKRMLEWGPMLNLYMGTNMEGGNSYPETLDELPPHLSDGLKKRPRGWEFLHEEANRMGLIRTTPTMMPCQNNILPVSY